MSYLNNISTKQKIYLKNCIIYSILVSIFAQIRISVFDNRFFLGLGVICIGIILCLCKNIYPLFIGIFSGILVVIIRFTILCISSSTFEIINIINLIPSMMVYIFFSIFTIIIPFRNKSKSIANLYKYLVCFDLLSNFVELFLRGLVSINNVEVILATALIRSLIECGVILGYKYNKLYIEKSEHDKRYKNLNIMVSKIYAEAFYLKKSTADLDKVMKEAYDLYDDNKNNREISSKALRIAQNAHEIRKNNDRVLKGIDTLLNTVENSRKMKVSEIFDIISENTKRQIQTVNKDIFIKFKLVNDVEIEKYYDIFAILNNLIINSIDACEHNNEIMIEGKIIQDKFEFSIIDNGCGVEEDVLPYIFNVGFSTKYDKNGTISTGIGLCHVKNLIENLNGTISVVSKNLKGTRFDIKIPLEFL